MAVVEVVWRTSPVVQWLRIPLSMQGARVPSPVWGGLPTCLGTTEPVQNYEHKLWRPQDATTEPARRAGERLCTAAAKIK